MNSISILLFIALLPVILICLFVYSKDKNKEPVKLLIKLFCLGIVSCFVTLILTDATTSIIPLFGANLIDMNFFEVMLYAFIGVAFMEELSKWLMVYFAGYKDKEFNELYDIIVYSVFVSLGFACFENILYILDFGKISTGIMRGLLSVPGHVCYAIYMGYFLSLAKIYKGHGKKSKERKNIILSIIVPTILHGIYDFCIMSKVPILVIVFGIFVITLYIFSVIRLKEIAKADVKIVYDNKYCPNCGIKVSGPFCKNCGTRQV